MNSPKAVIVKLQKNEIKWKFCLKEEAFHADENAKRSKELKNRISVDRSNFSNDAEDKKKLIKYCLQPRDKAAMLVSVINTIEYLSKNLHENRV